jgi:hypothetical protein
VRAIRLHKTSPPRLRPSRLFRLPWCRRYVHLDFRHIVASLHRFHESRFLRLKDGRLGVLRPIRLLESSLPLLRSSSFINSQDAENEFTWPFDTMKHCFIDLTKVVFKSSRRQIMTSHGLYRT